MGSTLQGESMSLGKLYNLGILLKREAKSLRHISLSECTLC